MKINFSIMMPGVPPEYIYTSTYCPACDRLWAKTILHSVSDDAGLVDVIEECSHCNATYSIFEEGVCDGEI